MGKRGKKPAHPEILRLRGSTAAYGRTGPPAYPVEAPPCPPDLPARARKEWRRVVPMLVAAGVIAAIDQQVIVAYCIAVHELWTATEALTREGHVTEGSRGQQRPSPWVAMQRSALTLVLKYSAVLGLSQSDRNRIDVPKHVDEAEDEFDAFLNGRHGTPVPPRSRKASGPAVGAEDDDEDDEEQARLDALLEKRRKESRLVGGKPLTDAERAALVEMDARHQRERQHQGGDE